MADIAAAQAIPNETAIGWIAHYAIGIIYAGALIVFAGAAWALNLITHTVFAAGIFATALLVSGL